MKLYSLAIQLLSTAFTATAASSPSLSVVEAAAKKYDKIHRDVDAAAAAATSRASRDLESIHTTSTSKSSKSSSYCPPEPTPDVQCGSTYVDSTVILGQNLLCNENITEADGSFNAVLTLSGEKALLNCQGYTISQTTVNIDGIDTGSAASLDCPIIPRNSTERLRWKQECGLFFLWGVILKDGARMVNCNIQKFWGGAEIVNGGGIVDSEFSLNTRGVNLSNGAANTMSKISNSEFYNNFNGLLAYQYNEDNAKVVVEDVISKNNQDNGIYLTGTGITVHNANIKNNLGGLVIGSIAENNEITLAGDVSITNNEFGFVVVPASQGTVRVTGNLISNRNVVGLLPLSDNFTIAVGGSYSGKAGKSGYGSLTACDNGVWDIDNFGGSTFEGSDYTCGTTFGPVPECKPCYPGCPSPEPNESSQIQQIASSSTEDLDLMTMDMEYPV